MKNVKVLFIYFIGVVILVFAAGCGGESDAANTAPVISSFQANPVSVNTNGQAVITVSAKDTKGDTLAYTYLPGGGTITGTGSTVTWIAPASPGSYVIEVSVSDGKLSAKSSVTITVTAPKPETPPEKPKELKIQWFGQSCFLITSSDGKRVLTDPFGSGLGYAVPSVEADVVTISHSHGDHNNVSAAKGTPVVIKTVGETSAAGIKFLGVQSVHDDTGGSARGQNIIFVWEMEGMRLAHLGDQGDILTDSQLKSMGKIDIVLIPVGGNYTVDAKKATKITEQLSPKLVFPMHYKTDVTNLPISTVDEFIAGKNNVEKIDLNSVVIKELPKEMKIILLNYK